MAAIIAQMALANRARKKRMMERSTNTSDKCVYELPPFDPCFNPRKHNKYIKMKLQVERKTLIAQRAKNRVAMFREMDEYEFIKELFKYQTLDKATIISDNETDNLLQREIHPEITLEQLKKAPDKNENLTEAERQRQMLITQNAEREFIMKRRWGGTLDVAGAIFSLFGILVFTFILFFLFIVFTNIRVTEVVILREHHQNVRNSELVSDGSPATSTNNESSWKTFPYPVAEEIGILDQLEPPS